MQESPDQATLPGTLRVRNLIVLAVCVGIVFTLLAIAVKNARQRTRTMQSASSLKQLSLAFLNYESAYRRLPMGGVHDELGPKQGWCLGIACFIESSPFYYEATRTPYAWDHPFNAHLYQDPHYLFLHPSIPETVTQTGFDLTHYMGNPTLVHKHSQIRYDDIRNHSQTWIVAECFSQWHPRGYPFNWRDLPALVDQAEGQPGIQIAAVDGSVQSFSLKSDLLREPGFMQASGLDIDASLTKIPAKDFHYSAEKFVTDYRVYFNRAAIENTMSLGLSQVLNDSEKKSMGTSFDMENISKIVTNAEHLAFAQEQFKKYPRIKVLLYNAALTDEIAASLAELRELEYLYCEGCLLSKQGQAQIASLPNLKLLYGVEPQWVPELAAQRENLQIVRWSSD
ncbi:MAG: DUF1559 domain-containing protein [Planctomycetota bacterium]